MSESVQPDTFDVIGVGFGPANIALAAALAEHPDAPLHVRFFEKQPQFGWHTGMLLDGTTMQSSFLKDLATLRNPSSRFTYLSYLHDRGRLVDFINHKALFPPRAEFHDYLDWAAGHFEHLVSYGATVVQLHPLLRDGGVSGFDVVLADGRTYRTRDVVVAAGLRPVLPHDLEPTDHIWHSAEFAHRFAALGDRMPRSATVIGAGQSAAEVVDHLHRTLPEARIHAVFSPFGYVPSDDTPYVNRIFDPQSVDLYYSADDETKRRIVEQHRNTNYSVVDVDLIEALYHRAYEEKVHGVERLMMENLSTLVELTETSDGVEVVTEFHPTRETRRWQSDIVVCATGYRAFDPLQLLGAAQLMVPLDHHGWPRVERDYRLRTTPTGPAAIYLQGATEHSHGISSSLLSNTAVRAGDIAASLHARRAGQRPAETRMVVDSQVALSSPNGP